jgi:hypothetical protein
VSLWRSREEKQAEKRARDYLAEHRPIASWGDRIHLCQDGLVRFGTRLGRERRPPEIVPLNKVRAEFGPAPTADGTPTRGWRQNLESRQAWLTISGPGFRWQDPIPVKVAEPARAFADAVNKHVAAHSVGPRKRRKRKP